MTQLSLPVIARGPEAERRENPVAVEKRRLNAAARRVLAYLQVHRSATNVELSTEEIGGLAAIRRVWDLTQDGWDIRKSHVRKGTWRYTLVGRK